MRAFLAKLGLTIPRLIVLVFIMGFLGFAYSYWRNHQIEQATYKETKVEKGDIVTSILATGTVQPENRLEMKPPISGRAEEVIVVEGQKVKRGEVMAWVSSIERATLLDAARAEGKEELKRWEDIYRPTPLVSPITGTVIARNIESGQTFANSDVIFVLSDRLTVKAQVDETDISQIRLRQKAEMVLDAYPNDPIPARVDQIAYEAKTVSNVTTYTIDVLPDRTPDYMRAGMTANVIFYSEKHEGVLVIPSDTIRMDEGNTVVLARDESGNNFTKAVKTGLTDGKRTEVLSGLQEGDVVLSPVFTLKKKNSGGSPFSPFGNRPKGGSGSRK